MADNASLTISVDTSSLKDALKLLEDIAWSLKAIALQARQPLEIDVGGVIKAIKDDAKCGIEIIT
ncbi:hypothetical protein [Neotabrizicola sp. sgz301269]|uniref:hypothetical protein n=1 Tax=Neotabrizicola sp. sgz301269 TaxID=3276282 RepID=UPI00376FB288